MRPFRNTIDAILWLNESRSVSGATVCLTLHGFGHVKATYVSQDIGWILNAI